MTYTALTPLHDRVIIRKIEAATKTAGGIIVPETAARGKSIEGEVVAVGPGKRKDNGDFAALAVNVGDTVLFGQWAGTEVKHGSIEYIILNESDILAKINDAQK